MSLGVTGEFNDPVTRKSYTSDSKYYYDLSLQIVSIIRPLAEESGGQMSLTDAYCTINRARGFEVSTVYR